MVTIFEPKVRILLQLGDIIRVSDKYGGVHRMLFFMLFWVHAGEYVCRAWKFWETLPGRSMGTAEEFVFENYHSSNVMYQSLCWICTRKYWRIFHVALWALLLVRTFSKRVTRVQSNSISLPNSTMSSYFVLVYRQLSWYQRLLEFTPGVEEVGVSFAVVSVVIVLDPEGSCLSVIVA